MLLCNLPVRVCGAASHRGQQFEVVFILLTALNGAFVVLAIWREMLNGTRSRLHSSLRATECGGLSSHTSKGNWRSCNSRRMNVLPMFLNVFIPWGAA